MAARDLEVEAGWLQRSVMCSAETQTLQVPVERCPEHLLRLCKAFQSAQREMMKEMGRKPSNAEAAGVDRAR